MTDITAFCWTLERSSPVLIKVVLHTAPRMAVPLKVALPPSARASVKSSARVRCGGRKWVGEFLLQHGAPPEVVREYVVVKSEETRRCAADVLFRWAYLSPNKGSRKSKSLV